MPVIVNETLARQFYHGNAVGRNLILGVLAPKPSRYPIVGVVADTREQELNKPAEPTMYFAGYAGYGRSEVVLIRTAGDPMAMAGVLRREVMALDAQAPVSEVRTMEEIVDKSLAGRKFSVLLISMFGALALVASGSGIVRRGVVFGDAEESGDGIADGAGGPAGAGSADGDRRGDEADDRGSGGGRGGGSVRGTGAGERAIWSAVERSGIVRGAAAMLLVVAMSGAWIPARTSDASGSGVALRDE